MTPWMLASLLASVVIAAAGGGEAGIAAAQGSQALFMDRQLRFSRSREQEADRIGLNTLVDAELDPDGMARMFERMQRAFRFVEKPPEFLLTHPLTESRIADARSQAERFAERSVAPSMDYQFMRSRVQAHYAETPAQAIDEARVRTGGGAADQYALAVAFARSGRFEHAVDTGRILHRDHPDSLLLVASFAEWLIGAGLPQPGSEQAGVSRERIDEALALLTRKLAINPDNAPLTFLYAKALNAADRHADAAEVLWRHVRVNPQDIDVWELLAETAGLAGDTIGVHRARAEYFTLAGAFQMAIQHLDYARRLASAKDRYLIARLDQRIIDLRTDLEASRVERKN